MKTHTVQYEFLKLNVIFLQTYFFHIIRNENSNERQNPQCLKVLKNLTTFWLNLYLFFLGILREMENRFKYFHRKYRIHVK